MTTATGNYKLFKMEKTEKIEVREFEMGTKELDKTLSRKLYETRGNATNCDDTKTKFSVQWSPLTLNSQGVVTFYWDFVARSMFLLYIQLMSLTKVTHILKYFSLNYQTLLYIHWTSKGHVTT